MTSAERAAARQVEHDLERVTRWIEVEVSERLVALILAGSYARGEGGTIAGPNGPVAYNDYDLIAVVDRDASRLRPRLSRAAERWSHELGVQVDLWPIDLVRVLEPPRTLFWLDVALGGARILHGPKDVLAPLAGLTPRSIPFEEAGRLLANRAVGLALSALPGEHASPAVRARHVHKAVLAVGDAKLLALDRYAGTQRERLATLNRLRGAPGVGEALIEGYAAALAFRARPDLWTPPDEPDAWYRAWVRRIAGWHLEFESWRVGAPADPFDVAAWSGKLFPELPDVRPGAGAARALHAAVCGVAPLLPWLGHPRERLARAAVLLAYAADQASARRAAARLLGAPSDDGATLHRRLTALLPWGS